MPLYNITLTEVIVVQASSKEEAEEIAQNHIRAGLFPDEFDIDVKPFAYFDMGWDESYCPIGDKTHTPICTWIDRGEAPEYTKYLEQLKNASKQIKE